MVSTDIACLLCQRSVSRDEIYGHVALAHFDYCRFSCADCNFRAPYSDLIVNHAKERMHSLKPVDHSSDQAYVSGVINLIVAQCLAANETNSSGKVLSDLSVLAASYASEANQTSAPAPPISTPPILSNASLAHRGVAVVPAATGALSAAVARLRANSSGRVSPTASQPSTIPPPLRRNEAKPTESNRSAVNASGTKPEALISASPNRRKNLAAASVNSSASFHNKEKSGQIPQRASRHDDAAVSKTLCVMCTAKGKHHAFSEHEKEAHVRQHIASGGISLHDGYEMYLQISEQWQKCFPEKPPELEEGPSPEAPFDTLDTVAMVTDTLETEGLTGVAMVTERAEADPGNESPALPGLSKATANQRRTNRCSLCGKGISRSISSAKQHQSRRVHVWTAHSRQLPFRCGACAVFGAVNLVDVRKHQLKQHSQDAQKCAVLQRTSEEIAADHELMDQCFPLEQRKIRHSGIANSLVAAAPPKAECTISIRKKARRIVPRKRQSFSNPRNRCRVCKRSNIAHKSWHVWKTHMSGAKKFICATCGSQKNDKVKLLTQCRMSHAVDVNQIKRTVESGEHYSHQYRLCFAQLPTPKAASSSTVTIEADADSCSPENMSPNEPSMLPLLESVRLRPGVNKPRWKFAVKIRPSSSGVRRLPASFGDSPRKKIKTSPPTILSRPHHGMSISNDWRRSLPSHNCRLCGAYASKSSDHVWTHHMRGVKRFTCGVCNAQHNKLRILRSRCLRQHSSQAPILQVPSSEVQQEFDFLYAECFGVKPKQMSAFLAAEGEEIQFAATPSSAAGPSIKKRSKPRVAMTTTPLEKTLTCQLCHLRVDRRTQKLRVHVLLQHLCECKLYECSACEQVKVINRSSILKHVNLHHQRDESLIVDRRADHADEISSCLSACFPTFNFVNNAVGTSDTPHFEDMEPDDGSRDRNHSNGEIYDLPLPDLPSTSGFTTTASSVKSDPQESHASSSPFVGFQESELEQNGSFVMVAPKLEEDQEEYEQPGDGSANGGLDAEAEVDAALPVEVQSVY